jgi:2-iminobutanoate/2-iminopropanoate deaminase
MMPHRRKPTFRNDIMTAVEAPALPPGMIERRQSRGRQAEVRVRALTGYDRGQDRMPRRLTEQCRQALRNGADSLASAGLSMEDVVRVIYLVHDTDAFPACFPMLRNAFGDARPGATLRLVSHFDIPGTQIEIELVARRETV